MQYELDDDRDAPKYELCHRAFYPSHFQYRHLFHHSNREHEPGMNMKEQENIIAIHLLDGRYERDNSREQYP